jgi:tRNA(Arg) A34 adenosine deaminase TadA
MTFRSFMPIALEEAHAAATRGEVPVGAVLTAADGRILARAGNRTRELSDPTAHAEILVLREACSAAGSERLPGTTLTVTLEPCPMCAAAIAAARVKRVIFGASDPKSGGVEHGPRVFTHSQAHHAPEIVSGIDAEACSELLRAFFASRR